MSKTEHRPGVHEVSLVVRHLKLEESEDAAMSAAIEEIDQIQGLDDVSFDVDSHVLNVAYDAATICIDCIEEVLDKYGIEIRHDWWTRFKEGYYRFVDQNVKDNADHEPFSCHKVPRGKY